tara:strand:- start:2404 stop:3420 length:1017 start_codon:yes stop_codon:yes gene_type:complete
VKTKLITAILITSSLLCSWPNSAETDPVEHNGPHNWGRWGADDQRGAANLITPESIVAAAKLIRSGRTFSLAIPIDNAGPVYPGRLSPHHIMVATGADYSAGATGLGFGNMKFADDYIYMPLQGSTQWDALSHAWYGDHLYNGVNQSEIRSSPGAGGATRLGVENVKTSFVGRGVLIDILAFKGGSLPPGYAITRADIEGAMAKQGTEVRKGDVVILRTGFVPGYYEVEGAIERMAYVAGPHTGIGDDVVGWIVQQDIAGIAADNVALEVLPNPIPERTLAIHGHLLRDLGVYIGEIWWLEELAADCTKDGRWEFFLAAQPLNIPGAVGSPLNPIAIK